MYEPLIKESDVVYISGKMSGVPFLNFPKFNAIEAWLKAEYKCKVLNPVSINPSFFNRAQCMKIDEILVSFSTVIFLLDGWEDSPGAQEELGWAIEHQLKVVRESSYKMDEEELIAREWLGYNR